MENIISVDFKKSAKDEQPAEQAKALPAQGTRADPKLAAWIDASFRRGSRDF